MNKLYTHILILVAVALIVFREKRRGGLKKPWYEWMIFGFCIILPWLIVLATDIFRNLEVLLLIVLVAYAVFFPLRQRLFTFAKLGRPEQAQGPAAPPSVKWWEEHPALACLFEVSKIALASLFSIVGYSILLPVYIKGAQMSSLSMHKYPLAILVLAALWVVSPLAFVFVVAAAGRFYRRRHTGILVGLLTAVLSGLILRVLAAFPPSLFILLVCPVFGGWLGEQLGLSLLRKRTSGSSVHTSDKGPQGYSLPSDLYD